MTKKVKRTSHEKWELIAPIIEGKSSSSSVSRESGISRTLIKDWVRKYKTDGLSGLERSKTWKRYSAEIKQAAVEDVLVKGLSQGAVVKKYDISDRAVLKKWITNHNSGKEAVSTSQGRVGAIMNTGRKTTFEERIEITEFTIARNHDYQSAMENYDVSYHQIYSWVKKYTENGIEGLKDQRGKKINKEESHLSDLEKAKLEIKKLKARNEFLEMQDAFGKKLKELEQRYVRFR